MRAERDSKEKDTHELIVEAAERLFQQIGFQKTTIADIATSCTCLRTTSIDSTANVYRFFAAKSEINEWVIMRRHTERLTAILEQIIASGMVSGEFPAGDTKLAARLVNTACIRFCHPRLIVEYEQDPEPSLDQMIGFLPSGACQAACLNREPQGQALLLTSLSPRFKGAE